MYRKVKCAIPVCKQVVGTDLGNLGKGFRDIPLYTLGLGKVPPVTSPTCLFSKSRHGLMKNPARHDKPMGPSIPAA